MVLVAPQGNLVVFTAAAGDQTAYKYEEKQHGLFTYYLLKKLQEEKGNVSLGDLSEYIRKNVARQSITVNGKSQTPSVLASPSIPGNWMEMQL